MAHPDQVVLTFNAMWLSEKEHLRTPRAETAGWIAPARLAETLALPFHRIGLTADRALFYVGLVQAGLGHAWVDLQREQARVGRGWQMLRNALSGGAEARLRSAARRTLVLSQFAGFRFRRAGALAFYGEGLAGASGRHPAILALAGAVRRLREEGIGVVVFVAPMNVEHLRLLGFDLDAGLRESLTVTAEAVRAAGGRFVDLHALLPNDCFADGVHFTRECAVDGPKTLAEALAPVLLENVGGGRPD